MLFPLLFILTYLIPRMAGFICSELVCLAEWLCARVLTHLLRRRLYHQTMTALGPRPLFRGFNKSVLRLPAVGRCYGHYLQQKVCPKVCAGDHITEFWAAATQWKGGGRRSTAALVQMDRRVHGLAALA